MNSITIDVKHANYISTRTFGKNVTAINCYTKESLYNNGEYENITVFMSVIVPPTKTGQVNKNITGLEKGDVISFQGMVSFEKDTGGKDVGIIKMYNGKPQLEIRLISSTNLFVSKRGEAKIEIVNDRFAKKESRIQVIENANDFNFEEVPF